VNIKDALSTFQFHKKKAPPRQLTTVWGESLDPKHILDEYPRPQLRRSAWVNLNGWWDYAISAETQRPSKFDGKILVPFSPESPLSGVQRTLMPDEYLWYHRTVSLSELPKKQRLLLHFGAVDQDCAVYWNGNPVDTHLGGYLSFTVDVTKYTRMGSNTLWVKVRDESDRSWKNRGKQKLNPGGMFYTAQSGIWQTVWMEWVPENHIHTLKLTPSLDDETLRLEVLTTGPCTKKVSVYEEGRLLLCQSFQRSAHTLSIPQPRPWSPESPFLYDLVIETDFDRIESYFAMRKFSAGADAKGLPRLFLNNQPYFQNGVLDQGYWPDGLYTAPSDDALIFDIQAMKDLGFNMIRKHLKIEPMRWYYHCDRLGMIVWQDMVNGGGRSLMTFLCYLPTALPFVTTHFKDSYYPLFSRTSKKGRLQWIRECRAAVEQLYNCPCIGMWVPFNEGWGQFDALEITEKMKHWDSTRLIDHASGWYDQKGGDVRSVHNYFRRLQVIPESRPYVISEYGGYTCHVAGHSHSDQVYGYRKFQTLLQFQKAFEKLQDEVRGLAEDGLAAAVYTQLSDVEEEVNGLFTYDRKINKLNQERK
jgi:hypothetical protein